MKLALQHAIAAILLMSSLAAPVAAGPLEDAAVAFNKGDCATTLRIIRPLAEQGDAVVQRKLGYFYETGTCVPKNYAEAMKWYRKAGDQGDAIAQTNLGLMNYKSEGVPQDYAGAMKWFRKAADQGNADAQYSLGVMYYEGQGVPRDAAEALKWFRKAAHQGNANAATAVKALTEHRKAAGQSVIEWIAVQISRASAALVYFVLYRGPSANAVYFLFWAGFSIAVAVGAKAKGRDGIRWFLYACLISPLLAGIILIALSPTGKNLTPSANLAQRVLWVTAAFYAVAIVVYSMTTHFSRDTGAPSDTSSIVGWTVFNGVMLFLFCLLGYWCLIALMNWRHKNESSHSWRIWTAWCCITAPIVWLLVDLTENEIPIGGNLYPIAYGMLAISSFFLSPIATLVGAIIGQVLFSIYQVASAWWSSAQSA